MRYLLITLLGAFTWACGASEGGSVDPMTTVDMGAMVDVAITDAGMVADSAMVDGAMSGMAALSIDPTNIEFGAAGIGSRQRRDAAGGRALRKRDAGPVA